MIPTKLNSEKAIFPKKNLLSLFKVKELEAQKLDIKHPFM